MADLPAIFSNIRRVVARGGRYLIFSALPEQLETYWLTSYLPAMMESAVRAYPAGKVDSANDEVQGRHDREGRDVGFHAPRRCTPAALPQPGFGWAEGREGAHGEREAGSSGTPCGWRRRR